MKGLKLLGATIERMERVGIWLAASVMFLMVMLVVIETMSRYVFRAPVLWAIEIPGYTLAFATALALAYTQRVRGHIAVGFIEARLSPSKRTKLSVVLLPIYLALVLFFAWATGRRMLTSLTEGRLSSVMQVPLFIPELLIFIGFIMLCLRLIADEVQAVSAIRSGAEFTLTKGE